MIRIAFKRVAPDQSRIYQDGDFNNNLVALGTDALAAHLAHPFRFAAGKGSMIRIVNLKHEPDAVARGAVRVSASEIALARSP